MNVKKYCANILPVVAGVLTLGFIWGYSVSSAGQQIEQKKEHKTNVTYSTATIDEKIKEFDKNKNMILEQTELVELLKTYGYDGAPIPEHAVPYFSEGDELKVEMQYGRTGPYLSITLPSK